MLFNTKREQKVIQACPEASSAADFFLTVKVALHCETADL